MLYCLFKSSCSFFYPVRAQKTRKLNHKKRKKALSWLRGHIRCLHGTWSRICFLQLQVFIWQFCFRITYKKNVFQQRRWTENAWTHRKTLCLTANKANKTAGVWTREWSDWIISGVSNRHCRVEDGGSGTSSWLTLKVHFILKVFKEEKAFKEENDCVFYLLGQINVCTHLLELQEIQK